ncbi:MAG TPA: serine hydrolase [Longimicrobiales bacterium]|nr:serine hydrolase [Longimicrobiales bacterium]
MRLLKPGHAIQANRAFRWIPVLLLFVLPLAAASQNAPLTGLDAYIGKAIKDWEVPGLSLAIVHRDSVVHAKGYGVKELGKPGTVTAQTVFAIGSASKAFTAALVGTLVDEGKLRWDDQVAKHLPGFQLYDPYASKELTVRDALSHRSGLARGDRLWYATEYDRDEILNRVRLLEPTWSFRSNFGYQNIMYLAAGQVAAKAAGKKWDDLVTDRIFAPLGMSSSTTSIKKLASAADVSTPHARIDDKVKPIAWRNIDNIAPAGSINSNALDMAQWVRLQLGKGKYRGKELLKPATVREMHSANTVIRSDPRSDSLLPETHLRAYGLGWFLEDYRGRKLVHHGGNIDGMSALVFMVPEENLGLVILTNMNGTSLPAALARRIADLYIGGARRDWSADYLAFTKEGQRRAAAQAQTIEKARVSGTKPSLALEKYAGKYDNEMYGPVNIELVDGQLVLRAGPAFNAQLEHWHYDTFRATWADPVLGRSMVTFVLDAQGRPATLKVEGLADFERQFPRPGQ